MLSKTKQIIKFNLYKQVRFISKRKAEYIRKNDPNRFSELDKERLLYSAREKAYDISKLNKKTFYEMIRERYERDYRLLRWLQASGATKIANRDSLSLISRSLDLYLEYMHLQSKLHSLEIINIYIEYIISIGYLLLDANYIINNHLKFLQKLWKYAKYFSQDMKIYDLSQCLIPYHVYSKELVGKKFENPSHQEYLKHIIDLYFAKNGIIDSNATVNVLLGLTSINYRDFDTIKKLYQYLKIENLDIERFCYLSFILVKMEILNLEDTKKLILNNLKLIYNMNEADCEAISPGAFSHFVWAIGKLELTEYKSKIEEIYLYVDRDKLRKFVTRDVIPLVQGTYWLKINDSDVLRILYALGQKRIKFMSREDKFILEDLMGELIEDPNTFEFEKNDINLKPVDFFHEIDRNAYW